MASMHSIIMIMEREPAFLLNIGTKGMGEGTGYYGALRGHTP